ncbi:MAG: riboflavin synthase [Candidatus Omnitrophota bacterium]
MFTGIIREIGAVDMVSPKRHTTRLSIKADTLSKEANIGDSISVEGVCLTVSAKAKGILHFDVMAETLKGTALTLLKKRDPVNLEPALRLGEGDLSGHLVSGHIDEIGAISRITKGGQTAAFAIKINPKNNSLIVNKGSIAVNGISLTVSETGRDYFIINMIPHSLKETTMNLKRVGDKVNIEYDIMGKYVAKNAGLRKSAGVDEGLLKEHGFM